MFSCAISIALKGEVKIPIVNITDTIIYTAFAASRRDASISSIPLITGSVNATSKNNNNTDKTRCMNMLFLKINMALSFLLK